MAEKPKVLEATSEEDTCNGFEENVINSQMKAMVSYKKKKNTIATHFRTSSTVLEGSSNHKLYILSESGLSKTRPQVQWLQDCHDFPHQEDGQEETCIGTSSSH